MKIYFAGSSGARKRESSWLKLTPARLLSYYEIATPAMKCHFVQGAFDMVKSINLNAVESKRD